MLHPETSHLGARGPVQGVRACDEVDAVGEKAKARGVEEKARRALDEAGL